MLRKLFKWIIVLILLYSAGSYLLEKKGINTLQKDIGNIQLDGESSSKLIGLLQGEITKLKSLLTQAEEKLPDWNVEEQTEELKKPSLSIPQEQTFSIYNISLGDDKEKVEKELGKAQRETMNEYGISWFTYHQNYQHFVMVSFDSDNKVAGLYTNQDLISSKNGIKYGTVKQTVINELGEPLNQLQKGLVIYKIPEERDYELYFKDNSYITVFFDKHENNTVTALQIISASLEKSREDFYVEANDNLKEGFEYQLFDLTNASRVNHHLKPLLWDANVKQTARDHSLDMAENNYFNHTNLEGESPFDRMLEDGIRYTMAGENLAYGQNSSIFAHEGLMNSLGHRENILQKDFTNLGVGVAFNKQSQPYYTENFLTK